MLKKSLVLSTLCATSIGLSGCSTMWSMASEFSADMAKVTSLSFLRGSSSKNDISFAEAAVDPVSGTYKTEVGEYVPAETYVADFTDTASYTESFNEASIVDTSPHPCPDGTYLTEDETCMSLDVDTFEFTDDVNFVEQVVDTSQHQCPDDTYLNDKNQCMFFETETFDFEDDVNFVEQAVDTSPLPCPEETYLTADGTCQFLNAEPLDLALNTDEITTTASIKPAVEVESVAAVLPAFSAVPSNAVALNQSVDCPEGFKATSGNSCMFVGAAPKT